MNVFAEVEQRICSALGPKRLLPRDRRHEPARRMRIQCRGRFEVERGERRRDRAKLGLAGAVVALLVIGAIVVLAALA